MLKYYSYYNVGGYKDMYLGNSSDREESSYFFPLLPVWKKKVQSGDGTLSSRVEALEQLKQIQILTRENEYGLPDSVRNLFSHGGYKSILTTADTGELVFALRDIEVRETDGFGRSIPFLLVIVGTAESDKDLLEKVAAYSASHLDTFSGKISGLFTFDSEKNGLAFSLAALTEYLRQVAAASENALLISRGEIVVARKQKKVPLLVLPEGIDKQFAAKEQALDVKDVKFVGISEIVPLDNHGKMVNMLKDMMRGRPSGIFHWKNVCLMFVTAILGFVLGYLLAIC